MMWERTPPAAWRIVEAARITCEEFLDLRAIDGGQPTNVPPGRKACRALISGRWHRVQRQYHFGMPVFVAAPITIVASRIYAHEAQR